MNEGTNNYEESILKMAAEILEEAGASSDEQDSEVFDEGFDEAVDESADEEEYSEEEVTAAVDEMIMEKSASIMSTIGQAAKAVAPKAKQVATGVKNVLKGTNVKALKNDLKAIPKDSNARGLAERALSQERTKTWGARAGLAAAGGAAVADATKKDRVDPEELVAQRVAAYFEEASMMKQAADEAMAEAEALQKAAAAYGDKADSVLAAAYATAVELGLIDESADDE